MRCAFCLGVLALPSTPVGPAPPTLTLLGAKTQALPTAPRLNREQKETCETDWSDKVEAYNIDETCARYHNQSTEVQFHPHSTKLEERWATQPLGGILRTKTFPPFTTDCPCSTPSPGPTWAPGPSAGGPPSPAVPKPSPQIVLVKLFCS